MICEACGEEFESNRKAVKYCKRPDCIADRMAARKLKSRLSRLSINKSTKRPPKRLRCKYCGKLIPKPGLLVEIDDKLSDKYFSEFNEWFEKYTHDYTKVLVAQLMENKFIITKGKEPDRKRKRRK